MLIYQIDNVLRREESFVLDFTKQEEIEKQKKQQMFKEDISKRLDQLIEMSRQSSEPVRNIAVDAGSALKDDRGTDAEELYKEAERLAQELKNGQQLEDATEETVELEPQKKPEKKNGIVNRVASHLVEQDTKEIPGVNALPPRVNLEDAYKPAAKPEEKRRRS